MPTKQDIIAWIVTFLICILFFIIGCVRESNNKDLGNQNSNGKINGNGKFMLCDTASIHNNTLGE